MRAGDYINSHGARVTEVFARPTSVVENQSLVYTITSYLLAPTKLYKDWSTCYMLLINLLELEELQLYNERCVIFGASSSFLLLCTSSIFLMLIKHRMS
jgi:hypothetical protein